MTKLRVNLFLTVIFLATAASLASAAVTPGSTSGSLGEAAGSITTLLSHAHGIIEFVFIICAVAMGTSAILKYRLHRRNPQQVPLSTPVMEASIALVLVAIPFLIEYSSSSKTVEEAKPAPAHKHYHLSAPPSQDGQTPATPPPSSPYPH